MKKDEKMNMSGKKKMESERLGMGFGNCRRYVSLRNLGFQNLNQVANLEWIFPVFFPTLAIFSHYSFLSSMILVYSSVQFSMKTSKFDS